MSALDDLEPGECAECHWMLYQHDDQCSRYYRRPADQPRSESSLPYADPKTREEHNANLDAAFARVGMRWDPDHVTTLKDGHTWKGGYV